MYCQLNLNLITMTKINDYVVYYYTQYQSSDLEIKVTSLESTRVQFLKVLFLVSSHGPEFLVLSHGLDPDKMTRSRFLGKGPGSKY